MALSDLAVFSEYGYSTYTEVLQQQVELFNAASDGAIILAGAAHQGDFSDIAFFGKMLGGTVRRRNPYGSGQIQQQTISHLVDTSVKVASGTKEFVYDHSSFTYIQQNPKTAGAAFGQQLAVDTMADMLSLGTGSVYAALSGVPEVVYDATGLAAPANGPSWTNLVRGAAKFGDMSSRIRVWLMHSAPLHKLYEKNLSNTEHLFTYGTVNVIRDAWGRLIIVSDAPTLVTPGTGGGKDKYHILGLQQGAIYIGTNNDFFANEEVKNGGENIQVSYQAEWTQNVGVGGFSWDKTSGGKAPTDAALFSGQNWERLATSHKDLAGVVVEVNVED